MKWPRARYSAGRGVLGKCIPLEAKAVSGPYIGGSR